MEIDLFIIGGGINGAGVAADAAGRGLSVALCEQDDLAAYTSSASSKLIHGGLRYLEQCEFRLVHEALEEREILMRKAPHLIYPLRFILPYYRGMRPAWLIRLGLFLYDFLARRRVLSRSRKLNFHKMSSNNPLKNEFLSGFSYMDCMTDDARLVIANALAAQEKGASIFTRMRCISAVREKNYWKVTCQNQRTKEEVVFYAKAIVNASGPWVSSTLREVVKTSSKSGVKLIKGSHLLIPRLGSANEAYILQHTDRRVIFVLPYQDAFTLIGTTDIPYHDDPKNVSVSEKEVEYLLAITNHYFKTQVKPKDIIWRYAGVRALYDDGEKEASKVTREYHLSLNSHEKALPLISIFGGKITTFRTLSEHVLDKLKPFFPKMGPPWTSEACLPGGDLAGFSFAAFLLKLGKCYPWLPESLCFRYAKQYGTLTSVMLADAKSLSDLGVHFGAGLYEREVNYLVSSEWAMTAEDILWRRTKLGLLLSSDACAALNAYLN